MSDRLSIFVAVKGHAFARDAFEAMLRAVGVEPTFVDQPAAARLMNPDDLAGYDALLLYDMWGMDFRAPIETRPAFLDPDPAFVAGMTALMAQGKGIVALHHAIAGWPGWPGYAQALGGRFLYKAATIGGMARGDSGYVGDVRYTACTAQPDHPVLAGLPPRFELTDELYRQETFADPTIVPLLRRETPIAASRYHSAMRAVRRTSDDDGDAWVAPPDDPLIGWAKPAGNSPLVYLQPGDSPATYADATYRRLLGNALRWVASPDAAAWARGFDATASDRTSGQ